MNKEQKRQEQIESKYVGIVIAMGMTIGVSLQAVFNSTA